MPRVVFTHSVKDAAAWASNHEERVEMFAAWGSNLVDYISTDGSNQVALSIDVSDLDAMKQSLASAELAAAKERHGVLEPVALYVESA